MTRAVGALGQRQLSPRGRQLASPGDERIEFGAVDEHAQVEIGALVGTSGGDGAHQEEAANAVGARERRDGGIEQLSEMNSKDMIDESLPPSSGNRVRHALDDRGISLDAHDDFDALPTR